MPGMAGAPPTSQPPDWTLFTLDLFCPRCRYNLRMLTGNRCPECGLDLEWNRMVAAAEKRVDSPLFEHHWKERPVRSFFRTVGLCLRPARLWTGLDFVESPRPVPLAIFAFLAGAFFVIVTTLASSGVPVRWWIAYRQHRIGAFPLPEIANNFDLATKQLVCHVLIGATAWLVLIIFRETFAKYSIRKNQLFRLIVYASVPLITVKFVQECAVACFGVFMQGYVRLDVYISLAIDCLAIFMSVHSLGWGLTYYLRIGRGRTMALLVAVLAFLSWIVGIVFVSVACDSWNNPLANTVLESWRGVYIAVARILGLGYL